MRTVLLILVITLSSAFAWYLRNQQTLNAPLLHVNFEHIDHTETNCIECHHNYVDDTGMDSCYACHKNHPEIAMQTESLFHNFCRDCHIEKQKEEEDGGPTRACAACHSPHLPAKG